MDQGPPPSDDGRCTSPSSAPDFNPAHTPTTPFPTVDRSPSPSSRSDSDIVINSHVQTPYSAINSTRDASPTNPTYNDPSPHYQSPLPKSPVPVVGPEAAHSPLPSLPTNPDQVQNITITEKPVNTSPELYSRRVQAKYRRRRLTVEHLLEREVSILSSEHHLPRNLTSQNGPINPFTKKEYPDSYKSITTKRNQLPCRAPGHLDKMLLLVSHIMIVTCTC